MSRISRDLANSAHHPQTNGDVGTMQSLRQAVGRVPNIAIIGAGVSGLRCADVLIRSGANVTVYEARNRVGGRLHQQESGGHLMDMGPNWIHGSKGNPIVRLAEKTGTAVMEPVESSASFDSSGQRLPSALASELFESMWSTVLAAFKHSDEHSSTIDPQTSLYDYFVEILSKKIKDPDKLELALNEAKSWGPFVGDPIERQSLKFFFLEECIDDENVFVASTYQAILAKIAQTAVTRKAIHFSTEITHFTRSSNAVELTTSTGDRNTHDEVIITCPLGWLKHHHTASFTPALPPRLTTAINNISYGRLEKLYVTFPTAWWLSSPSIYSTPSSDSSTYPSFTHFHPPTYHPSPTSHPPSSSWSQNVVSLSHLPSPHAHPTLLFYLHGDCATQVVDSISSLPPQTPAYSEILIAFAEPFYSLLPNYDAKKSECRPSAVLCTTWQADKFAGNGSYSNFQVGLTHADEDIEVMRDSGGLWRGTLGSAMQNTASKHGVASTNALLNGTNLNAPDAAEGEEGEKRPGGIWLAGEHVAPFVALGTTTGAYWSGEGVARRVLGKWGIDVVEDVDD